MGPQDGVSALVKVDTRVPPLSPLCEDAARRRVSVLQEGACPELDQAP